MALRLAEEQGRLVWHPGGVWTPPGEPMEDRVNGERRPTGGRLRYATTATVRLLRKRGALDGLGRRDAVRDYGPPRRQLRT